MRAQLLAQSFIVMAVLACASAHTGPPVGDATRTAHDQYGEMALPFGAVGHLYFLAGATPDSTKTLFVVDHLGDDGFDLDLTHARAIVHRFHLPGPDQFRAAIKLAPGVYDLTLGEYVQSVVVPRLGRNALAQPIPMQTTAIIGRDTAIDVYLEAYGASDAPLTLSAPGWCDTLTLRHNGNVSSDTIPVPLSRLAPGVTTLVLARGQDTAESPVFVGFPSTVTASFDRALDALRYLAPPDRLDSLRRTPPDQRPQAWATFMAEYGPRLPDYFARVSQANARYAENGTPGWETDRGSVYLQLGDPDLVFVKPDIQIWVYTRYFGRLEFDHHQLVPASKAMLGTLVAQARSAR